MWCDRLILGPRDVIGAWLIVLLLAAACFCSPILSGAFDTASATRHAAAGCKALG